MEQSVLSKHFQKDYVGEGILAENRLHKSLSPTGICYHDHAKRYAKHTAYDPLAQLMLCEECHKQKAAELAVSSEIELSPICQTCGASSRELVIPFGASTTKICTKCMESISTRIQNENAWSKMLSEIPKWCEICKAPYGQELAQCPSTDLHGNPAKYTSLIIEKKAQSDTESFDLTQIPMQALLRLGAIFKEGESKYGRANWRKGIADKAYQLERANHALKHLLVYIHLLETGEYLGSYKLNATLTSLDGNRQQGIAGYEEDDLAKVMWFCVTQCELERLESVQS